MGRVINRQLRRKRPRAARAAATNAFRPCHRRDDAHGMAGGQGLAERATIDPPNRVVRTGIDAAQEQDPHLELGYKQWTGFTPLRVDRPSGNRGWPGVLPRTRRAAAIRESI